MSIVEDSNCTSRYHNSSVCAFLPITEYVDVGHVTTSQQYDSVNSLLGW